MSRKKTTSQQQFSQLGLRLSRVEKDSGLDRAVFARKLSFSPSYITYLIKGQRLNASDRFLDSVCREFNVIRHWLLTGEGPIYNKDRPLDHVAETTPPYLTGDDALIQMTREILASGTHLADSLNANIRSFYEALQDKQKLLDHERRLAEMEAKLATPEADPDEEEPAVKTGT